MAAQKKQDEPAKDKIAAFLNDCEELRDFSKYGFTSSFSGEFNRIPDDVQTDLAQNFPGYKFYIVKMNVLIDPPIKKYDLILITDINTTEIKGFVWVDYWMLPPSKSFETIFKGHQAGSTQHAVNQIKAFAKLIVSANNDKIGDAKVQKGKVRVQLLRGEGVSGILEVQINEFLQFDNLTIIAPDGKKLRRFV